MTAPTMRKLRVTCFVPPFNAGDTTRGLEVCRALVDSGRGRGRDVEVIFVAPKMRGGYEAQIRAAGFDLRVLDSAFDDATIAAVMIADHAGDEFVRDLATARRCIAVLIEELRTRRPDLVVYGFVPPAGIAAQVVGVPSVSYLPFPAHRPWVRRHLLKDIPDELENGVTARAPRRLRRLIARVLCHVATTRGFFAQPTLAAAGRELGWRVREPDLFAMLAASVQLVNDHPAFYRGQDTGPRTRITGPLFCDPRDAALDEGIRRTFAPGRRDRVFVSMGSSGEKRYLLAAIEALAATDLRVVAVVPQTICTMTEVRSRIAIPSNVYLTDAFIPARQVNAMSDVAVIHGGQGTVQTAIASGTPIVGVGMQVEQSGNLDNVARRGAGVRIARRDWTPHRVREEVRRVLTEPSFARDAAALRAEFAALDGRVEAGRTMWKAIDDLGL